MRQAPLSPEQIVDANLAAYNARDIEAFMRSFDAGIEVRDLKTNEVVMKGLGAVRAAYGSLFAGSPSLHAHVTHRSVVGQMVVDHEIVTGRLGGDVEIVITYNVIGDRIGRVWFVHEPIEPPLVRRATIDDLDAVLAVGRQTYAEHFSQLWSPTGLDRYLGDEFERETVASELASSTTAYFLVSSRGSVLGFAKARGPKAVPAGPAGLGVELQKIYLRKASVARGAGTALLKETEAYARACGYPLVWLDVLSRNPGAARFYRRHGYEHAGEERFMTDLGVERMLVMVKQLA